MNPFEKPKSSDPFDVLAQVTGIRTAKTKAPPIERSGLKKLINVNEWEQIGQVFGFEPRWVDYHGVRTFDWTSCNPAFWEVFQPCSKGPLSPGRAYLKAIAENEQQRKGDRVRREPKPKKTLIDLHRAQYGECIYCWHPTPLERFSVDHVVPLSRGGKNIKANRVGACVDCNTRKGSLSVEVFEESEYLKRKRELVELSVAGRTGEAV